MSNFQICLCGTQPSYPHTWDCPFPYFGHASRLIEQWELERKRTQEANPLFIEQDAQASRQEVKPCGSSR